MSRKGHGAPNARVEWKSVGRRIRELRGFDTTQEFAKRIGVSAPSAPWRLAAAPQRCYATPPRPEPGEPGHLRLAIAAAGTSSRPYEVFLGADFPFCRV